MKKITLVLLLLVFLLAGCGAKDKELTVYTYSSFPVPLIEKVQAEFKENHGIDVKFKSFSDTGPLFNQLLQEKKNPVADVVIGLDNNYFVRVVKEDLFHPYRPQAADKIREDLIFDPEYRLIPFDYGFVLFNYDREKLDRVPTTHKELLDPYFKGKIIMENPLTSSPGQVFLLTTVALFGEEGYLDYWKALKENILAITPGWDEAYGMYTSGEAPIVLTYGTSPVYHLLYDKTERYQALVLDNAAYAQIEGVGVVKGTKRLKAAQMLVDYLLSEEFQEMIPENQFMYPARSDVKLPESFRIAANPERLLNLPQEKVEENLDRWLSDWEKAINE